MEPATPSSEDPGHNRFLLQCKAAGVAHADSAVHADGNATADASAAAEVSAAVDQSWHASTPPAEPEAKAGSWWPPPPHQCHLPTSRLRANLNHGLHCVLLRRLAPHCGQRRQ